MTDVHVNAGRLLSRPQTYVQLSVVQPVFVVIE